MAPTTPLACRRQSGAAPRQLYRPSGSDPKRVAILTVPDTLETSASCYGSLGGVNSMVCKGCSAAPLLVQPRPRRTARTPPERSCWEILSDIVKLIAILVKGQFVDKEGLTGGNGIMQKEPVIVWVMGVHIVPTAHRCRKRQLGLASRYTAHVGLGARRELTLRIMMIPDLGTYMVRVGLRVRARAVAMGMGGMRRGWGILATLIRCDLPPRAPVDGAAGRPSAARTSARRASSGAALPARLAPRRSGCSPRRGCTCRISATSATRSSTLSPVGSKSPTPTTVATDLHLSGAQRYTEVPAARGKQHHRAARRRQPPRPTPRIAPPARPRGGDAKLAKFVGAAPRLGAAAATEAMRQFEGTMECLGAAEPLRSLLLPRAGGAHLATLEPTALGREAAPWSGTSRTWPTRRRSASPLTRRAVRCLESRQRRNA